MARYIDADGCFEDYVLHRALFGNDIDYIDYVKKYPTADVSPVIHAHWIDTLYGWKCSNCKEEQEYTLYLKHCPNCGAKMNEVTE